MSHNPLLLLCDAACKLPCLQNNRNAIVQLLNDRIADSVPRGSDTRSDVLAILQTAAQYPDGLAELREIVGFFDAGKTVFNEFTPRLDRYLI